MNALYFAGYTPRDRFFAKKLFFLGITLTLASLVLNPYLSYTLHRRYLLRSHLHLEENVNNTFILNISENDIAIVSYDIVISWEKEMNVSIRLLDTKQP